MHELDQEMRLLEQQTYGRLERTIISIEHALGVWKENNERPPSLSKEMQQLTKYLRALHSWRNEFMRIPTNAHDQIDRLTRFSEFCKQLPVGE